MCNLGEPLKLAEVDELIKNFDEDGDGTIDIHEVSSYCSFPPLHQRTRGALTTLEPHTESVCSHPLHAPAESQFANALADTSVHQGVL